MTLTSSYRFSSSVGDRAVSRAGLVLALGLILPAAVLAQAPEPADAAESPALVTFEAVRAHIAREVEAGELAEDVGKLASEVEFVLQKELIRADAEIAVLKLEVKRYSGAEQEEALAGLMEAVAAREALINEHVGRLQRAAGLDVEVETAVPEKKAKGKKRGKLKITFEPEDPTSGEDP